MLLNLPSIRVVRVDTREDLDYHFYGIPMDEPKNCRSCEGTALYTHGYKCHFYVDTPIHGRRVGIFLSRQRYKCRSCGVTFFQSCDDISERHLATNRLVTYIQNCGLMRTFTSIADEIGLTEGTVRNIVGEHITTLEKYFKFEPPEILGLDEVHLNRQMRLVLTNIGENSIIDLISNRKKQVVIQALYRFKDTGKIRFVTMDMWRPYKEAVNAVLPYAVIIIDKFHIVKMANEAIEKGRKHLREQMSKEEVRRLKKDRFLMLRRRRDLDATQEFLLSGWTENYPLLFALYDAKERFYDIWEQNYSREEAEQAYQHWKNSIPANIRKYFYDLDRAIENWHSEVFNYFDYRVTNAYTESINNQIKSIVRQGRGYSFGVLRAKVLFAEPKNKYFKQTLKSGIGIETMNIYFNMR